MDAFSSGKRAGDDPELAGGIIMRTWLGIVLKFHQRDGCYICKDYKRLGSQLELLLQQLQKDKRAKRDTLN